MREILDEVRAAATRRCCALTERFDRAELGPSELRVDAAELEARVGVLEPDVLARPAHRDRQRARRGARPSCASRSTVELPEGQRVEVAELPVRRAGALRARRAAPPTRRPWSCAPSPPGRPGWTRSRCARRPGPGGEAHPVILAACALCGVDEVYRMGGAQAIAALAYGTESVPAVDVIAGPGQRVRAGGQAPGGRRRGHRRHRRARASWWWWPRRAPTPSCRARPAGPGRARRGRACSGAISPDAGAARRGRRGGRAPGARAPERGRRRARSWCARPTRARRCASPRRSPPSTSSWWARRPRRWPATCAGPAACSWAAAPPRRSATTWPARNHVLPTGGAARFQSALSAATFRRRMARVSLPGEAAARLAPAGAALARAEGFPVHAESMERRA